MQNYLRKFHAQRKFWQPHGRLYLCWIFYYVNDNTKIDLENTQIMHPLLSRTCNRNKFKNSSKGLISYYKKNGKTSLKKHVDAEHVIIAKMFEKKKIVEKKRRKITSKNKTIVFGGSISKFFFVKDSLKKKDVP